jgi:hypothetical protein
LKGFVAGLVILGIAVLNLGLFFGLEEHEETDVRIED